MPVAWASDPLARERKGRSGTRAGGFGDGQEVILTIGTPVVHLLTSLCTPSINTPDVPWFVCVNFFFSPFREMVS